MDSTQESLPLVSVVMPVYNGTKTLDRVIRSVLAQSRSDWELLAVDDASTDGSWEVLCRYAAADTRVRPMRLEVNNGPGAARNAALAVARGQWIAYVDQDDEFFADYFEHIAKASAQGDVLVFAYDLVEWVPDARPNPVPGGLHFRRVQVLIG
jgi:glycosyltransferase involved in cell wall biosynthesis